MLGNYIGVGADGLTAAANDDDGIALADMSGIMIGGSAVGAGNVISGNTNDGIFFFSASTATILGNKVGTDSTATIAVPNGGNGIWIRRAGSSAAIGDGTTAGQNIVAGNGESNVYILNSGITADIIGNRIGVGAGGEALGAGRHGIQIDGTSSGQVSGNIIAHNDLDGVFLESGGEPKFSIIGNSIFDNGNLGIDLHTNGPTANDNGDGDGGANERLNYPVIGAVRANGTVTLEYDITLDVPAHGQGYRVEFFKNSAADPTGFGEGEIFLGFVDVSGSGNHSGFLAATETVSVGDIISTTATRKTGANSYDITSEFSFTYAADALVVGLDANLTLDVYDPASAGLFAIPSNDMVTTLTVANTGNIAVDSETLDLIVTLHPSLTFYNGDFDEAGPATEAVLFIDSSSGVIFNVAAHVRFKDGTTKPADFDACDYSPASGYDPAVSYVCIKPGGSMQSGDPDPSFALKFRSQIQ